MIAVIFEVQLADGQSDEYLSIAQRIRCGAVRVAHSTLREQGTPQHRIQ